MDQVHRSPFSKEAADGFYRSGYAHFRDIFSQEVVDNTREIFLKAFADKLYLTAPYSNATIINDIYSYFPGLVSVLMPPAYIEAVRSILGDDLVWMPECSVHHNRYLHWHKDTTYQESKGEKSHHDLNAPIIQAAIYFQENNEYGGGLSLIPGTQLLQDKFSDMEKETLHTKAWYWLLKRLKLSPFDMADRHPDKIDVPTLAGDLLLFDVRVDHCGTKPRTREIGKDKLAVFNTFAGNNEVSRRYFEFMKSRSDPYYRYYEEYPLPKVVYDHARSLGVTVWY